MIKGLIAIKQKTRQAFSEKGERVTVTDLIAKPLYLVGTKTIDKDGYSAFQLGLGERKPKNISKAVLGTLKKGGLEKKPPRFISEIRAEANDLTDKDYDLGTEIKISEVFAPGNPVSVSGITKGKGFQGVVKRHSFKGGPKTHGQSDRERAPGSIGMTTTPGRVFKGKKMAGRMGGVKVQVRNLKIFRIDDEKGVLSVTGTVPGPVKSLITVLCSK